MTDQQPTAPRPPARPPLVRRADDRAIAGVCGAVARHLGVDATLVRIVVAALAFLGGTGVLAYLAGWLLIPAEEGGEVRAPGRTATVVGVGVLLVAGLVVLPDVGGPFDAAFGLAGLAALGALVWWLATRADGSDAARRAGAVIAVLALTGALAVGAFWAAALGGNLAMAIAVTAAGVGLAAAAFVRSARWAVVPALAVALTVGFVAAAGLDLTGGVGERTYRPATLADVAERYELGAGEMVIDLRDVDFAGTSRRVVLDVGIGEARVLVPEGTCVAGSAKLGMGGVEFLDRDSGGVDVDFVERRSPRPGAGLLVVDAEVGLGHVEVDTHDDGGDDGPGWWDDEAQAAATGCVT